MKRSQKLKRILCYALAAVIFLAGILMYAYPFVNRKLTSLNREQTLESFRFVRSVYNDAADAPVEDDTGTVTLTEAQKKARRLTLAERNSYDKSKFNELKAAMQDYNKSIYDNHQAGLKDAWSYEEAEFDLTRYGVYENVLAELRIPSMDCDLPLYLGATWSNMAWGAVQLGKTSMPIGGKNTNCVIAGHRGCTNGPYFLYIENMQIGDKVYIDNLWETLTYKVTEIKVISPDDIPAILIQEGKDMVTLITCHPYPYNYQRYAVFCERCPNDPPVKYDESGKAVVTTQKTDAATPQGREGTTEEVEVTRKTIVKNSSAGFIQAENVLTYVIPVIIILLAAVLFFLGFVQRKKRQKRTHKSKFDNFQNDPH